VAESPSVTIPDKPAFKAGEVCEIAQIQPYVLRSWESEFPELGLSKTPGGPRVYRRGDVERVLRIRDLVFTEGLTLSGVRRRFEAEQPPPQDDLFSLVAEIQAAQAAQAKEGTAASSSAHAARVAAPSSAAPGKGAEVPPAPIVSDAAREQLGKLKQDMRSLLEMLGGEAATPSGGIGAPMPAARKRPRRA
jgi:DNA-binding transcriptional MerR regulator